MTVDEQAVIDALRRAGARFAVVHGSRAEEGRARPDSDLDVGAWWADTPPAAWDVQLPAHVDLVALAGGHAAALRRRDSYIRERYRRRREQLAGGSVSDG